MNINETWKQLKEEITQSDDSKTAVGILLDIIEYLLSEVEAKDKRIAELEETEKLLKEIASELAGTDRMACLSCSNHMKKLHGEHQGCDGNCEHKYGMPKNADEVIAWFKGD